MIAFSGSILHSLNHSLSASIEKGHLGDWSPEKDCCWRLTFRQPVRKPSSAQMASAPFVETSVANKSPSQDSNHPDDLFQSRYVTPGFKPFSHSLSALHFSKNPDSFFFSI